MHELLDMYPWVLPIVIFFGRICDVSLGTLRIIFVSKGEKNIAPLIGFVEVFIWVLIIAQVLSRANDLISYISYAGGYAAGTYIGLSIESKIGFGYISYRIFTVKNGQDLVKILSEAGYGATMMHGTGSKTEIDIVETTISRKAGKKVEQIVYDFDPDCFYLIEDVRSKQRGIFTPRQSMRQMKRK